MRYALVTGGSRGIGRAISIQLAKDGYHVIVNYLSNHEAARETLRLIAEAGGEAELLPFDVSKPEEINAAMDKWQSEHTDEYIEVLVNNAGIASNNVLLDLEPEQWHAVIDTNLNALFYLTRIVVEGMVMEHQGRIINISSIAAQQPFKGQMNYCAAKGAVESATRALALELAPKQITVNAVAPGLIETEMIVNDFNRDRFSDKDYKKIIPMKRFGTPEDVAYVVSFLASEKASYVSGQVIGVNGMYGSLNW